MDDFSMSGIGKSVYTRNVIPGLCCESAEDM